MNSLDEKCVRARGYVLLRVCAVMTALFFLPTVRLPANPVYVSFQEGDVRVGGDKTTVGTAGTLVDAAYSMGATVLRSDAPATVQDGSVLLVGNNTTTTNRTLLSFNLSFLTNVIGTNSSRLDSAALLLTHDTPGAGSSSVHAVYLTSAFEETTATWNNPHGGNTNAGGFIGAGLRERSCVGTSASPTRELWGSPTNTWPDTGTGPDSMVEAVRSALASPSRTLYVMIKRKSESATAYYSRYQQDGSTNRDSRPELIVGIDSVIPTNPNPSTLACYYFNENSNSAPSLAAAAAATVPDSNRVWAANAAAGGGLGVLGPGGTVGNTHGYGTASYVSSPSGLYVRASVTASDENKSVANNDYVSFTLGPRPGYVLNLSGLSAWARLQASNVNSATVVVRSGLDGFSNELASLRINGTTSAFTMLTNSLSGPSFSGIVNPVEFRFYFFDDTDSTADIVRLDDVFFFGAATNPPGGMQIVTLAASDSTATESGGDPGEFTLCRYGDASGTLAVTYALSGTASNGSDYARLSGSTNFAPGVMRILLPVLPIDNSVPEPIKTVILTLNTNAAYVIAGSPTATVTIADDNDPPEFNIAATAPFAQEGTPGLSGIFTISRSLGDTNTSVAVQIGFGGTATQGLDYTADATNSIRFGPGVLSQRVTIMPVDDHLLESNETVILTLLPGSGYSVGASNSAAVTIFDNEGMTNTALLIEAESFTNLGGWVVDQQFADLVGSVYLLAHGKGKPVADATTTAQFPAPGIYRLWVRTKDWTAPLADHPGSFKVLVGGVESSAVFGAVGQGWLWQDGGLVNVPEVSTAIRLHDLTGFDGRCDALLFTTDLALVPPNSLPQMSEWRRGLSGLPAIPPGAGNFDLVVVGGGLAGCSSAIAAARLGLQVALIHDRPFPGGNCSRDVRVHTLGNDGGGITGEINTPDLLIGSDQFIQTDLQRMQVLQAETNLHLFTEWRAFAVRTNGAHISSVDARHNRSGEERRFAAPVFVDSTGDGWIGYWAGALHRMGREARSEFNESLAPTNADTMTLGTTLSWNSISTGATVTFPAVPWATNVAKDYYQTRGDWYWEFGLLSNTIYDAEAIRDHLLQAIYGTWWNVKQRAGNANLDLDWVAYIGGKRESRRLVGDYILTEADVRNHPFFEDAVVTELREIDLHYPQGGNYDFLTYAQFTSISPYWIPFRCLYSTNIDNLMMAGRCLSATHVGLGSPRVMNTCGQMGVATGTAAALCKKYGITPRGVYQNHRTELQTLIGLDYYFGTPPNTVSVVDNADTNHVQLTGAWTSSTATVGYYHSNYIHDGNTNKGTKSALFRPEVPLAGNYRVYLRWTGSSNRANNVPVDVNASDGTHTILIDQTFDSDVWFLMGVFPFSAGSINTVVIRTTGTTGYVIADAVVLAADFAVDPSFSGMPWEDDDADGVCNYVEWLNGTDPYDPFSFIKVNVHRVGSASVLRLVTQAGRPYTIEYSDSLADSSWRSLIIVPPSVFAQEQEFTDPLPSTNGMRFYRVVCP